jgi:uncharacterized protein (DUF302 family)
VFELALSIASRWLIQRSTIAGFAGLETLEGAIMSYYFSSELSLPFADALLRTTEALRAEGFGIITQIDVSDTLKKKLGVSFRNYHILGACDPSAAYQALQLEDKVGTMLPCNVIVQETGEGRVEIAAIDPLASMQAIANPDLRESASDIGRRLKRAVEHVGEPDSSP